MAGGIDTSNRKPRRMRGTPAIKFSNRLAAVVIGFGVLSGLLLSSYLPLVEDISKKSNFNVLKVSEEEQERRQLFNFIKQKRGEAILKILEDAKDM